MKKDSIFNQAPYIKKIIYSCFFFSKNILIIIQK